MSPSSQTPRVSTSAPRRSRSRESPAVASQVAICNRAMEMLGQAPIVSISDSSAQAKALNRVYNDSRRALLEDHPWNFAKKRASLAASATAPTWKRL